MWDRFPSRSIPVSVSPLPLSREEGEGASSQGAFRWGGVGGGEGGGIGSKGSVCEGGRRGFYTRNYVRVKEG